MPLLRGEPFKPIPPPADLKPDEEVFFCHYTKEAFRSYDEFFGRQFLCNSCVWSCRYTGLENVTFEQALKSEEEYLSTMGSIQSCHKETMLSIAHHSHHTNINMLIKEVFLFFKERFVSGEELDYHQPINGNKKVVRRVVVVNVIHHSPVKTPVTTTQQPSTGGVVFPLPLSIDDPLQEPQATPLKQYHHQQQSSTTPSLSAKSPVSLVMGANCEDYSYVVKYADKNEDKEEERFTTSHHYLSRPKKSLTKDKMRLFLKSALYRNSDKSPLLVKPEYVSEFDLGPSSVLQSTVNQKMIVQSAPESRKRTASQTSLDSFFTPSEASKKPLRTIIFNPLIKDTPKAVSKSKKTPKSKSPKKRLSKTSAVDSSNSTPRNVKTPKSKSKPSSLALSNEAKRILKRTKSLKQMDVRKSLVKKRMSLDSSLSVRRKSLEDAARALALADKQLLKERLKQDRLKKSQELREKRKKAKQEQIEWLKPREDLLCEDSKPLPHVHPIQSAIPNELFSDVVVIMEFLCHYGPAFNMSDVIPDPLTYGKLEEALRCFSTETILFDLLRFLLQAIFSTMEEEHEDLVDNQSSPLPVPTTATTSSDNSGNSGTITGANTEERIQEQTTTAVSTGSRRSSVGSIPVEGLEDQESRQDLASISIASIKASALEHARWSYLTQASSLQKLTFNVYTCSEVLRLHLMSCGGYNSSSDRQWFRFCSRGGYTDSDDPVVELRLSNPKLIESLSTTSFFDLSPSNKAHILACLCSQLLMFSASREAMEEILTQAKQTRKKLRELRFSIGGGSKKKNKQAAAKGEETTAQTTPTGETDPVETKPTEVDDAKPNEEKVKEEIAQLEKDLYPLTAAISLKPLGYDRFYNKYWLFPSLPGLYVETFRTESLNPIDSSVHPLLVYNSAPDTSVCEKCECCVSSLHDLSLPCDSSWSVVSSDEEFRALVSSLNPRGIRESQLKQTLEKMKDLISESLVQSPFLSSSVGKPLPSFNYSCANDSLELQLREQILDIEEKLYIGNLGYVRDSISRKEWREKIENSGAARAYSVANGEIVRVNGIKTADESEESEESEEDCNSVALLSNALLQIQAGIEKKYLLSPLGTAVDMKKKGKEMRKNGVSGLPVCLEQWRASLLKATTFSQVSVHLSTLERSVAWSKSIMNVRCRFCRRKGGDEYMLLCDGCDHGYHTYCLRPPLSIIPEGDWFCNDCCPVTPVKRRRTVSMVSLKELSDSESEEHSGGEEEDEDEEEEEEDVPEENSSNDEGEKRRSLRASTRVQSRQYNHQPPQEGAVKTRRRGRHSAPLPHSIEGTRRGSRKRLKLDDESSSGGSSSISPAEMIISAIIDIRCSKKETSSQAKAQHTLEIQLCKALLEEMTANENSRPFMNPVRRREFPDYHEIIKRPMDLKTISLNVSTHKYSGLDDFLLDVNLIFANCSTYHKRNSKTAKAGVSLRKFVEQRYSDLGLGNLANVTISGTKTLSAGLRSSNYY